MSLMFPGAEAPSLPSSYDPPGGTPVRPARSASAHIPAAVSVGAGRGPSAAARAAPLESSAAARAADAPDADSAFGERMLRALNEAALVQMISIGHRTGLLDGLADLTVPHRAGTGVTASALAWALGLQERYVREWLAAMTVAGVVAHDPHTRHYWLPASHAALLTRRGDSNLAVLAQYLPILGAVEDDVVRCFREGGGVPYARFGRLQDVMAEESAQTEVAALDAHILPLVPGLAERLNAGIRVLDLGCGAGRALLALAERFPASEFVGYDLSVEAIAAATRAARARGLGNVRFAARDLTDFDRTAAADAFDFVTTFDAVHHQPRPAGLLCGIHRTLRAGGVYLMQEIHASSHVHGNLAHPLGTLLYAVSCMHGTTVSLAQGGEGLGAMWGRETAERLLREAGFRELAVHRLAHDVQHDYWVARR